VVSFRPPCASSLLLYPSLQRTWDRIADRCWSQLRARRVREEKAANRAKNAINKTVAATVDGSQATALKSDSSDSAPVMEVPPFAIQDTDAKRIATDALQVIDKFYAFCRQYVLPQALAALDESASVPPKQVKRLSSSTSGTTTSTRQDAEDACPSFATGWLHPAGFFVQRWPHRNAAHRFADPLLQVVWQQVVSCCGGYAMEAKGETTSIVASEKPTPGSAVETGSKSSSFPDLALPVSAPLCGVFTSNAGLVFTVTCVVPLFFAAGDLSASDATSSSDAAPAGIFHATNVAAPLAQTEPLLVSTVRNIFRRCLRSEAFRAPENIVRIGTNGLLYVLSAVCTDVANLWGTALPRARQDHLQRVATALVARTAAASLLEEENATGSDMLLPLVHAFLAAANVVPEEYGAVLDAIDTVVRSAPPANGCRCVAPSTRTMSGATTLGVGLPDCSTPTLL
jgi:hypothetical protein